MGKRTAGALSTEYELTLKTLAAAAAMVVVGAALAFLLEPAWVGLGISLGGVPLAGVALFSYAHSRGQVKAATELGKTPPSRVV